MNNMLLMDRIAFSIGKFDVYWYGLIISSAIFVAILVACFYCSAKKLPKDLPINIALVILPVGILVARLFAVIFEPGLSISDYFNFRTGGMSIIGAIVGGGLALFVYGFIKKDVKALVLFDVLASVLLLAQSIGRWGNFVNQEVYGQIIEADSQFAKFPFAVEVDGVFYQALFFYESCANAVGFAIASIIFMLTKTPGLTTSFYLIFYGTVRAILEPLRQSEFIYTVAGIEVSRLLSFIMIAVGVILLICVLVNRNKVSKGLKNEEKK